MATVHSKQDRRPSAKPGDVDESPAISSRPSQHKAKSKIILRLKTFIRGRVSKIPRTLADNVPVAAAAKHTDCATHPKRYLKIRIMTWNMHDTLPKGDLGELLGTVPPYVQCPVGQVHPMDVPNMTEDDQHPYHLVVIAGQECPTVFGFPMGLGGGFRSRDKEKYKNTDKNQRIGKTKDDKDNEGRVDVDDVDYESVLNSSPPTSNGTYNHNHASGWSWILDEWHCRGRPRQSESTRYRTTSVPYHSQPADVSAVIYRRSSHLLSSEPDTDTIFEGKQDKIEDKKEDGTESTAQIGPYELLAKKRLMGTYMAIYIYRDLRPLVRGISKSAVSTGMIGGRVGNKGGVGMSLNLDGTTLLFVNAHLTAHEGRVNDRLANWTKIKSDLHLDPYLDPSDPRRNTEDITDRFDYTFLCGDLNFRLNISRPHADWLISQQEYDKALAFDQLREHMASGDAFSGFHEAPIDFPPTFKYDVPRSKDFTGSRGFRWSSNSFPNPISSEAEERDCEATLPPVNSSPYLQILLPDTNCLDDSASNVSIDPLAASVHSPSVNIQNNDVGDHASQRTASHKSISDVKLATDSRRPNFKWKPLFRKLKRSAILADEKQTETSQERSRLRNAPTFGLGFKQGRFSMFAPRPTPFRARADSGGSFKSMFTGNSSIPRRLSGRASEGVYDSSSKRRVPSWCDRILWKSTVGTQGRQNNPNAFGYDRKVFSPPRMIQILAQKYASRASSTVASYKGTSPYSSRKGSEKREDRQDSSNDEMRHQTTLTPQSSFPSWNTTSLGSRIKSFVGGSGSQGQGSLETIASGSDKLRSSEKVARTIPSQSEKQECMLSALIGPLTTIVQSRRRLSKDSSTSQNAHRSWRFFPFLYRESNSSNGDTEANSHASPTSTSQSQSNTSNFSQVEWQKGEVVVIQYRTLDDKAMQKLEGRSDHRPVIGSYAIYL